MENNKFLEKINRIYNEFFATEKIKYEEENFYVRNNTTSSWELLTPYGTGQTKLRDSSKNLIYVSTLRFLTNNKGPFNLDSLVMLVYNRELHKYYGWLQGFWSKYTLRMYFDLLKTFEEPLHEHYIKNHHNSFYKAIRKQYSDTKQKYQKFLIDMGENPEVINGRKNIDIFLQQGTFIEHGIVDLLKSLDAPFNYFRPFSFGTPDIYIPDVNEVVDIKRHIKTKIKKEADNYAQHFNKVTVIYLLGSRELDVYRDNVRKLSVFKWLREQNFFKSSPPRVQDKALDTLEKLAESINMGSAIADRKDYHRKLVEEIIKLDKEGLNNVEIAAKVLVSSKYINMILVGRTLKEYIGDYAGIYLERRNNEQKEEEELFRKVIYFKKELKVNNREIADELQIPINKVSRILRKSGMSETSLLAERDEKIKLLFNQTTDHKTKDAKMNWVLESLKIEYPQLTFSRVKGIVYKKIDD
ncbi:hypothetical protein ACOSZH_25190 [Priestia megaterium]|uniref:hypothetical protein n=1 Tax=Priestia megaterium TaxID=1404 RepID=UPI003BA03E85